MAPSYNPVLVERVLAAMAWNQLPPGAGVEACLLRMVDILRDAEQVRDLYERVNRFNAQPTK